MAEGIGLGPERRYGIEGRVVTMNARFDVLDRGVLYIEGDTIADVRPADAPPPTGFEAAEILRTGDTLYPGMIELHNHLSYNILPLWAVPKAFEHHSEWKRHPEYKSIVSANMAVLGRTAGIVEAIVRYVECKCLLGGVTASQGVSLNSNQGIKRHYRGLVRNVEQSDHPRLQSAGARISDVEPGEAASFRATLERRKPASYLLHLSEGINDKARGHFTALKETGDRWAITPELAGIHCLGLEPEDFQTLARFGGNMVWSPLSNLLLYGRTADIASAKAAGVTISLGSDWSPSGSKSLLGELKVAEVVNREQGDVFAPREIVAMATSAPAKMLGWHEALGSLEKGKLADLFAVNGRAGDPYTQLLEALETGITLVVIGGIPRVGQRQFMTRFSGSFEPWKVGRSARLLNLEDPAGDPIVAGLTLEAASQRLSGAMRTLTELALELEAGSSFAAGVVTVPDAEVVLDLDFEDDADRTELFDPLGAGEPLSERVVPLELDPLTVVDDPLFFEHLAGQRNLPEAVKRGLPPLYGEEASVVRQRLDAPPPNLREDLLASRVPIGELREHAGLLSNEDRQRILREALAILEESYVHLPFKRAMHAVDPVQRLRLMIHRFEQEALSPDGDGVPAASELAFHGELTSIFNSLHDLHTNYIPAFPFRQKVAYLPFVVEKCHEGGRRQYLVTKLLHGSEFPAEFVPGVELLHYNGTPIARAVELNAERLGGSNRAAQHAQGLFSLTIRPLVRSLVPDEDWATVTYRDANGEVRDATFSWQVLTLPSGSAVGDIQSSLEKTTLGFDPHTDQITEFRKFFYASGATTEAPGAFYAKAVPTDFGEMGYLRIFSFHVPNADAFVERIGAELTRLPERGLIVDVRGNGGGLIHAAERLLQLFTPRRVEPLGAQFISTAGTLRLCRNHAPSKLDPSLDLRPWVPSLLSSVATGATYSVSHPITSATSCNEIGQRYYGPVVLVTDALCYSATDIFAASFVDNRIGVVLGIDANTGAGGANVWSHRQLRLLQHPVLTAEVLPDDLYHPLPHGSAFTVAIRRLLRVGDVAGTPLEDLGIAPHVRHAMTKRDLLKNNADLIHAAAEILSRRKPHSLRPEFSRERGALHLHVHTTHANRLDVSIDGRPTHSEDIVGNEAALTIEPPRATPPGGTSVVELRTFEESELVALRRERVAW